MTNIYGSEVSEKLIKFQKEIKEWDLDEILNTMMYSYSYTHGSVNEKVKEEYNGKILLLKMEIQSRLSK